MKSLYVLPLLSAFLALPGHADDKPDAAAASGDTVVLKVDGDPIKKSDVDDAWKAIFAGQGHGEAPPMDAFGATMKDKFLNEVASEHLLYREAEKENVEDTPEFKASLEKIKHQLAIQQLLKEKTKDAVTEDKLKAAYNDHLKDSGEEYHARHILVKTKAEAEAVEKKLKGGADFDKLAKEKSQDKTSGASGGDLGWFTSDKMVPPFSAAVEKMKKGEISQPVQTDFGWHVIQLEDVRKPQPPAYDEVKDALKQEVGNKAVNDYVKGLMANAKVTEVDASGHETPLPPPPEKDAAADKGAKATGAAAEQE